MHFYTVFFFFFQDIENDRRWYPGIVRLFSDTSSCAMSGVPAVAFDSSSNTAASIIYYTIIVKTLRDVSAMYNLTDWLIDALQTSSKVQCASRARQVHIMKCVYYVPRAARKSDKNTEWTRVGVCVLRLISLSGSILHSRLCDDFTRPYEYIIICR